MSSSSALSSFVLSEQAATVTGTNDVRSRSTMSIRTIVRNLKTVQSLNASKPYVKIINAIARNPTRIAATEFLSDLDLHTLNLVLSDPAIRPSKCLKLFEFVVKNQSSVSFEPDLRTRLTVVYRLVKSRSHLQAESLFSSMDSPFLEIASTLEDLCEETIFKAKLFDFMIRVYSKHGRFGEVSEAFRYAKKSGIEIDERSCTSHLLALKRGDRVDRAVDFFDQMVDSGLKISVYSLSVIVDGLCCNGEIEKSRELVQEMICEGTKANVVTFNTMLKSCAQRWDFVELDLVLLLMRKEGVEFNLDSYGILIDGFASFGRIEEARKLVREMHDRGLRVSVSLYNLVIRGCFKTGCAEIARSLFDEMLDRNVTPNGDTYWGVISCFCKAGEMDKAMGLVNAMQRGRIEVDEPILGSLIDGFCEKGMIHEANRLLLVARVRGFGADFRVIERIVNRLFGLNREAEGRRLLSLMVKSGAKPDWIKDKIEDNDNGICERL